MQSRELPPNEINDASQAGPSPPYEPADSSVSAMLKTLPISVIVRILEKRIVTSVRDADFVGAFLRLRSCTRSRARINQGGISAHSGSRNSA